MSHSVAPSVSIYILQDSKLLLGRRINTGWGDGYLCPPGGHIEKNESPTTAIVREIKEELGVDVDQNDIEFLSITARNTRPVEYAGYGFIIQDKNYEFYNAEPEKCSELVWVDLDKLPDDIVEDFRSIIEKSVVGKETFLELGY